MFSSSASRQSATVSAVRESVTTAYAGAARVPSAGRAGRHGLARQRIVFAALAAGADFTSILLAYCGSDFAYMTIKHGQAAVWLNRPQLGVLVALIFCFSNLWRHRYGFSDYLNIAGQAPRAFAHWNVAFLAATTLAFLARVIEDSSRGVFIIFYAAGLSALYVGRAVVSYYVREGARGGRVTASRALVVGFAEDISGLLRRLDAKRDGVRVVAIRVIPSDRRAQEAALVDAVALARELLPDDVVIAVPWERADVIDKCTTAFMRVPAALHLDFGPDCVMSRFAAAPENNRLMLRALQLHGDPMTGFGGALKRLADVTAGALGLIGLAPLFLLIACAIKLESPGPVFFRQRRYGFNKAPFHIWKFRTMSTMEDGERVRQATRHDPRITRLGAVLRRYNLDELPQLLNVVRGEMSLVGPRPHAIIHDQTFEPNVSLYARRHNVRPGITGWAQVNGHRGETDTGEKIAHRINHDLYYIDNWSLALDLWILVLTFFSRKAYANAR